MNTRRRRIAADPCTSLTPAQQAEFGVDDGSERTVDTGPKCGVWSHWAPTEVGGRPAAAYMLSGRESCDVAVGLSDTSTSRSVCPPTSARTIKAEQ